MSGPDREVWAGRCDTSINRKIAGWRHQTSDLQLDPSYAPKPFVRGKTLKRFRNDVHNIGEVSAEQVVVTTLETLKAFAELRRNELRKIRENGSEKDE